MKHAVRHVVEQVTFELEVDDEIDLGLLAERREGPGICQVLQWSLDGADYDLTRSIQGYLAGKALLKNTESNIELGDDLTRLIAANTGATAPRDEQRVLLHIRDHQEKLIGRISERLLLLVPWHSGSCDSRVSDDSG